MSVLEELSLVLEQRKAADPEASYVAGLHAAGLNKILEKVGEEATEVILAAKDIESGDERARDALAGEVADLIFHNMVMLSHLNMDLNDVFSVLEARFGLSGLDEKAGRQP